MTPSKSLKDQLHRLLRRMQSGGKAAPADTRRWFHRGAHLVSLNDDENREYEKITTLLMRELAPGDEISEGKVTDHLNEAIFVSRSPLAFDLQGRVSFAAARIFEELQRPVRKWDVHFPVVGFYDECLPFTMGVATLFPSANSLSAIVLASDEASSDSFRAKIRKFAREQIDEHFGGSQWARVTVRALEHDAGAAKELALAELELVLDVINFFADIFRPMAYRCRAALGTDLGDRVRASCAVMEGSEPGGVDQVVIGPHDDVWLPPIDSVAARELGLDRAGEVLASRNRTEVEQRLLAALRWGGRGTAAERLPDRFLYYMMALEAVLNGPKKSAQIAKTVESRAAQLLADDNSRSRRDPEVEHLYDLRSKLVHTGWAEISHDHVMSARYCAKECTVRILTGEPFASTKTNAELDGWFAPL